MGRRGLGEPKSVGVLVVDKPLGVTSHDVVSLFRRSVGMRQVGHAGTLDPYATGVLVLGFGKATKLLGHVSALSKEYVATIRLGISTTTDDAEGEVVDAPGWLPPNCGVQHLAATIDAAMGGLRGHIDQVPSSVSAIKVGRKRAYARVRAGEKVVLDPRPVTVDRFEILRDSQGLWSISSKKVDLSCGGVSVVDVEVTVECSSGTYVRALARDLGRALGCEGHLIVLRRTRVGPWNVEDAIAIPTSVETKGNGEELPLMDLNSAALHLFDFVTITLEAAAKLVHGVAPKVCDVVNMPSSVLKTDGEVLAVCTQNCSKRVLGLLRVVGDKFKIQNVFVTEI